MNNKLCAYLVNKTENVENSLNYELKKQFCLILHKMSIVFNDLVKCSNASRL